ncbi:MAG: hypothetical protein IKG87_09490 [Clostridia bacterium]|nr:hypothetical protein [Clostridia bacterium]
MELVKILLKDADRIAPLVAAFRAQLKSYKGIIAQPDIEAGNEEIIELLSSGFPVYAVADDGILVGYIVCRIDEPCLCTAGNCPKVQYKKGHLWKNM